MDLAPALVITTIHQPSSNTSITAMVCWTKGFSSFLAYHFCNLVTNISKSVLVQFFSRHADRQGTRHRILRTHMLFLDSRQTLPTGLLSIPFGVEGNAFAQIKETEPDWPDIQLMIISATPTVDDSHLFYKVIGYSKQVTNLEKLLLLHVR